METKEQSGGLAVETPQTNGGAAPKKRAGKKATAKKSLLPAVAIKQAILEAGAEILFKVKRLHGYHGTVLDVNADGSVLCRVNEDALEGEIVIFAADQLVVLPHPEKLKEHSSTRLPWDYKS